MKILALVTDGFGARGGIARYNAGLFEALALCDRVETVTIVPRYGDARAAAPDKCVQAAPRTGKLAWIAEAMRRAPGADVVYCGHLYAAPLAALLARKRKLWMQAFGFEAWSEPSHTVRTAIERADLVTSISRYTRARLLSWSDIDPHLVRILPCTYASLHAPRPRRADLVAKYGRSGRKTILTVGRLAGAEQYKGHDRIIRAMPEIRARRPEALYLIVGDGDDAPRLRALAKSCGVDGHVVFAGHAPEDDLPDFFALADLFAMPSAGEGFGIVFLEAIASGLPALGGNRDGSVDALADGALGTLVDPYDEAGLAAAIVDLLGEGRPGPRADAGRFDFRHFSAHVDQLVGALAQ